MSMWNSTAQTFGSHAEFLEHLQATADIVFPVLHGLFGEGGGIQVAFLHFWPPHYDAKLVHCRIGKSNSWLVIYAGFA